MKVAIIGLGKLGLPYAAVTNSCHDVLGIDINETILNKVRNNEDLPEPRLNEYLTKYPLKVSSNISDVAGVEMVHLFTNTEAGTAYAPTSILKLLEQLKPYIKDKIVIINSTLEPGTFQNVIVPFLNEQGITCRGFCYNPVMVAIGDAIAYYEKPPFVVLAATNEIAKTKAIKYYQERLGKDITILESTIANVEITKYAMNIALINRIALMNFLAEYCDHFQGNIDFLAEVFKKEERVTGKKMLQAGLGFGGPCFPMDVRAFKTSCLKQHIATDYLDALTQTNVRIAEKLIGIITSRPQRRVSALGVTYKPGTPYTIESQALEIAQKLADVKEVMIYDPQGMENARKELGDKVKYAENLKQALQWGEILLVSVPWPEFDNIERELKSHQFLIDPWGLYRGKKTKAEYLSPGRIAELTPSRS